MTNKIIGKAHWAKILGEPVPNYNEDGREWTLDVEIDENTIHQLNELNLTHKIKDKNSLRFVTFKRNEFKKTDNAPNTPINVVGYDGKAWDRSVLLGNGTKVEVTFKTYNIPAQKKRPASIGWAILQVKVLELVPYEGKAKGPSTPSANGEEEWS